MTTSLMSLHVTPHTKRLPTARVRAFVGFLAGVRVGMDFQTAGSGESLVAGWADVAILGLREDGLGAGADVVVVGVLPDVAGCRRGHALHRHGWWRGEVGGEWALVVDAWSGACVAGFCWGVEGAGG